MDNSFDPDAYLVATAPSTGGGFDPDAYIAATGQSPSEPYKGSLPGVLSNEQIKNEPGLQDTTVTDAMTVDGALGLGEVGAGLAAKGIGSVLDAIPATENVVPSVERIANNQTLKSMGGTMGQLGQMERSGGREGLDAAAKYARDNGLTDIFSTQIGREKQLEALKDASGKAIGSLRDEAGPASDDIMDRVVNNPKIDKYLGNGSASKELGGVDTALNDIKEVGGENPTHSSLADAATYINKNAAGAKLYQPANAETDVANILSRENNTDIAQKLGSDKAKEYVEALDEQSKLHPLEHLQERGELRNAGGRGGLGTRVVQAIADKFGYRMSAKMAGAIHDALTGDMLKEAATSTPKSLAKTVPADISEWMQRRQQ